MDFRHITLRYYSRWLGCENILLSDAAGISFIRSAERDKVQAGYSSPLDIYAWVAHDRLVISYGEKAAPAIALLQSKIADCFTVDAISLAMAEVYGKTLSHHIKFVWQGAAVQNLMARALAVDDYEAYLAFFQKANPDCTDTDWVRVYFAEMAAARLCCGVFDGGALVSCTDAPLMPYMQNEVQEIGIHTLPDCRGKGYAAQAAMLCTENIIRSGKCPQWSCMAKNIASSRLAQKLGFTKLADVLTLML